MIWNKIQDKSPRDKQVVIVWDGSGFEFCKYLNGKFILRDANKPAELSSSYKTREDITNIVESWAELEELKRIILKDSVLERTIIGILQEAGMLPQTIEEALDETRPCTEFQEWLNRKYPIKYPIEFPSKKFFGNQDYRGMEDPFHQFPTPIDPRVYQWEEIEEPKNKSDCGDGKPKRTGLSSLVGKLSKEGGREMMRQVAEIRGEFVRPSGVEGFTKLTYDANEVMGLASNNKIMTVTFSTKWGKNMGDLAGQPNYFVQKIWRGLITESDFDYCDMYESEMEHLKKFGRYWDGHMDIPTPKLHTIRQDPHDRWKPGANIHFVINNRTKDRFQFAPIIQVKSIQRLEIRYTKSSLGNPLVYVGIESKKNNGYMLCFDTYNPERKESSFGHIDKLASNDGFDSIEDFFKFFNTDFTGKIIHWTPLLY